VFAIGDSSGQSAGAIVVQGQTLPALPVALPPPPPPPPGAGNAAAPSRALAVASKAPSTSGQALSLVRAAPEKEKVAAGDKAFIIPGLQNRPFSEDDIRLAFDMMDLDVHGCIGASDIRRVTDLCGDPELTDAEIGEMIRLLDTDGNGVIDFAEFRKSFTDPLTIFRNFDIYRAKGETAAGTPQESTRGVEREAPRPVPETPPLGGAEGGDPRGQAVAEIAGKKALRPEFLRQVYQRFIEIDTEDYGFVTYEAFCLVLRRAQGPVMRRAFDAFDVERLGEIDLRQFVVGMSMFTSSPIQDKLRFAFMMYDEEQVGSISRDEFSELLKAMSPYLPSPRRENHIQRTYALHGLHPNARLSFNEFAAYAGEHADELVPSSGTPSSEDTGEATSTPPHNG